MNEHDTYDRDEKMQQFSQDNVAFFCRKLEKAFTEMSNILCEPISPDQARRFNAAKDRFWLNANRARKEHGTL